MKRLLEDKLILAQEKQRIIVNETSDKVDYLQSKLLTIETNLPVMI